MSLSRLMRFMTLYLFSIPLCRYLGHGDARTDSDTHGN
jgi:hypothetical protein